MCDSVAQHCKWSLFQKLCYKLLLIPLALQGELILGGVNRYRYSLQVNRPQETQHMLFTVHGKVERVLRFYRRWVSCQIYSFSSTCPPLSRAEPRTYTHMRIHTSTHSYRPVLSKPQNYILTLEWQGRGERSKDCHNQNILLTLCFFVNRI